MIFWKWLHTIFGKISSKTTIEETVEYGHHPEPALLQNKDETINGDRHIEDENHEIMMLQVNFWGAAKH